jgi:hypothetical protein
MIIIAVVMVGLIAVMGLAIDGGNLFVQRRNVQNAADSAALAGTRLLAMAINTCNADPVGADLVIAREVNKYAEQNGVNDTNGVASDEVNDNVSAWYVDKDSTVLGQVGGGTIPTGSTGILANLQNDHQTYFLQVVGMGDAGVTGSAQAMTGPVTQLRGGGLIPIAVHVSVPDALDSGEDFRVIDVNNKNSGGFFCVDKNGNGEYQDTGIDLCVGDPAPQHSHRGWLNLNYIYNAEHLTSLDKMNRSFEQNVPNRGCGSNPDLSTDDGLKGWASRDACPYPYTIVAGAVGATNGDFIHGSPGARDSSLEAVEDTFEGVIGYVPLFDHIYMSDWMDANMTAPDEPDVPGANLGGDHWPRSGGGGHAYLYHIVGFAAVKVHNVGGSGSNHYIDAEFVDAYVGDGVFLPGPGYTPGACHAAAIHGVNLWK